MQKINYPVIPACPVRRNDCTGVDPVGKKYVSCLNSLYLRLTSTPEGPKLRNDFVDDAPYFIFVLTGLTGFD